MKKQIRIMLTVVLLFATTIINAQAPQSFNYQAVLRDSSGNLITSGLTEMRFTIRNAGAVGPMVYQETKTVTPNQFGLVNHAVGTGSVVSGTMAGIAWDSGVKFLQVEVNTGSGFVSSGAQQLVSVPYALEAQHAATADLATNSLTTERNNHAGGTRVYNLGAPGSISTFNVTVSVPASWVALENHVALVTSADAREAVCVLARLTSTTNLEIKIQNLSGSSGSIRVNYIIFPLN